MKKLIFINGTMGSGKTATARELRKLLDADWLDGDWCWIPQALCLTEEKKALALENIGLLLRYELRRGEKDALIFSWVMHRQEIIDELLEKLAGEEFEPHFFTLLPDVETLRRRLRGDVDRGLREPFIIGRAIGHLPGFAAQRTVKIDNSDLTPRETAEKIRRELL